MVCILYFIMIKLKFIENQKGMTTQPRDLNFNNFSVTKKKLRYDQAKEILTLFLLQLLLWLLLFLYRSTIKRSMSSLYFISNEKMFTTTHKNERRNFWIYSNCLCMRACSVKARSKSPYKKLVEQVLDTHTHDGSIKIEKVDTA